ncbi:hypothetical protein E0Z10_g334 [Xylaria hypoxylon]|uniref:C2H2-type domain-containing protein n=1 Tax=Xylaria hypoxylon TaxID=37992 RepID=A0A4Z0YWJ5_9PEZI|nr:hypothetical protein E0Z10_g334 [Xylaria hypoxylon]
MNTSLPLPSGIMSYTCDRCQRELFGPASWNAHLNPEQHVDAQHHENEGLDTIDPGYGYGYDATLVAPRLPRRVFPPKIDAIDISITRKEYTEGFVWFATGISAQSDELTRGMPLGSLPATLRDAVKVTLDLGIPYIWIDALCIFQDSTDDLAKEIANMETYIQQAVLVLQPSLVKSVHDPFLNDRVLVQRADRNPKRGITLDVQSTAGQPYSVVLDPNAPFYQPDKEPVNSRAWIMQERLLCPRVLILPSVGGMLWQCDTHERIYGQIHYAYYVENDRNRIAATWRQWDLSPQAQLSTKEVHNAWLTQVDDYNKRDLTNPQDKLLAISGLAKRFKDNYDDVLGMYCAGSWYNFLNVSLHWQANLEGRSAPAVRPTIRGIPSWSWANVHNSMYLSKGQPIIHPHFRIHVVSCEVDLLSPGFAWGNGAGGKLALQGVLVEVFWNTEQSLFEEYEGSDPAQGDSEQGHLGWVQFDFEQDDIRGDNNVGLLLPVTDRGAVLLRKSNGIHSGNYVAGLLRFDMRKGLLWYVWDPGRQAPTVEDYRAPSWSWASNDYVVRFVGEDLPSGDIINEESEQEHETMSAKHSVQIHDTSVTLKGSNPYGEVTGATLKLAGVVRTSSVVRISASQRKVHPEMNHYKWNVSKPILLTRHPACKRIGLFHPDKPEQ